MRIISWLNFIVGVLLVVRGIYFIGNNIISIGIIDICIGGFNLYVFKRNFKFL